MPKLRQFAFPLQEPEQNQSVHPIAKKQDLLAGAIWVDRQSVLRDVGSQRTTRIKIYLGSEEFIKSHRSKENEEIKEVPRIQRRAVRPFLWTKLWTSVLT